MRDDQDWYTGRPGLRGILSDFWRFWQVMMRHPRVPFWLPEDARQKMQDWRPGDDAAPRKTDDEG